jgi:peroxiredoxin family protein
MKENAMMKKMGRGMTKASMQEMFGKKKPAAKKAAAKKPAMKMGAVKHSSNPDGVIKQGGTRGTMIRMAKGGKAC